MTWAHTTPLICTVGSTAEDTVVGSAGSTGAVSALAVEIGSGPTLSRPLSNVTASSPTRVAARRRRPAALDRNMFPLAQGALHCPCAHEVRRKKTVRNDALRRAPRPAH